MEKSPINVCLVSPLPPPYGGIGHWTAMICKYALGRKDVELVVVNTAPRWRSIHTNGVLFRAIGGGLQLLRDSVRLLEVLLSQRMDMIHLTTPGSLAVVRDLAVVYLASLFRVPLVYHIRFGRIPDIAEANTWEWRLIAKVMDKAFVVVAIDRATLCAIQLYAPKANALLIPNCVDLSCLPSQKQSHGQMKTVLFVGWVIPAKGINELVDAWKSVNSPDWTLEIVGPADSAYQEQLRMKCNGLSIKLVGELPHELAMEHMSRCDIFVLPSYTEGFPNVVLEAMALGKPIVATDVGAIPEMLEGGAGVLIKSRSSQELAQALGELIGNAPLRERIGSRAHDRAIKNYTIDAVFDAYLALWSRKPIFSKES